MLAPPRGFAEGNLGGKQSCFPVGVRVDQGSVEIKEFLGTNEIVIDRVKIVPSMRMNWRKFTLDICFIIFAEDEALFRREEERRRRRRERERERERDREGVTEIGVCGRENGIKGMKYFFEIGRIKTEFKIAKVSRYNEIGCSNSRFSDLLPWGLVNLLRFLAC